MALLRKLAPFTHPLLGNTTLLKDEPCPSTISHLALRMQQ